MRALTVIGIAFIAGVGVDVGLSFLRPGQWLPATACAAIGDLGIFVSSFIVPALFIFTSIKARALKSLALRAFLAVLGGLGSWGQPPIVDAVSSVRYLVSRLT
jgi:hypothetical protein